MFVMNVLSNPIPAMTNQGFGAHPKCVFIRKSTLIPLGLDNQSFSSNEQKASSKKRLIPSGGGGWVGWGH